MKTLNIGPFSIRRNKQMKRKIPIHKDLQRISHHKASRGNYSINPSTILKRVENFSAPLQRLWGKLKMKSEEHQDYEVKRYAFNVLEDMIILDPLAFSAVCSYRNTLQSALTIDRFEFGSEKDEKWFRERVWPANKSHFQHTFLNMSPIHLGVFGNGLVEMARGKTEKERVLDCVQMDMRQYEFWEDSKDDKTTGAPATEGGYIKGFIDENHKTDDTMMLKNGENVVWQTLQQLHETEWAFGWFELMYKYIHRKEDVQDAQAQQDVRQGYPVPLLKFGNDQQRPSKGMRNEALLILEDLADPLTIGTAYPNYIDVEFMDSKIPRSVSDALSENIKNITNIQAGIMGIPVSIMMMTLADQPGSGNSNAALMEFYEYNVRSMARKLHLEQALAIWRGKPDMDININYDEILSASSKERIMNIHRLGKAGMLPLTSKKLQLKLLEKLGFHDIDDFSATVEEVQDDVKKNGGEEA